LSERCRDQDKKRQQKCTMATHDFPPPRPVPHHGGKVAAGGGESEAV
jgi:hypothetical protein